MSEERPIGEHVAARRGAVTIGGERVEYEARAETTVLRDDRDGDLCSIFSVSYVRTDRDPATRPLIYAFDGGPGTASVTLHLGLLGPRRADFVGHDRASRLPPPLVDNERSLLEVADLVVLDPVGTGFSRVAPGQDPRRFYGYTEDVRSVARFIAGHSHRTGRSRSPLIVLGESYGGARAAGVVFELQDRWSVYPAATILLVPVLSSQALSFTPGNDLPYVVYLPTMAAAARYHGRVEVVGDVEEWLEEVERFVVQDYASALLEGRRLDDGSRRAIAKRIAGYTGLSAELVELCNLRVTDQRFFKELLRDERCVLSRADCRLRDVDGDPAGDAPEHDPYTDYIRRALDPVINAYLRGDLGFETDLDYLVYNSGVLPWDFSDVAQNSFLFAAETLRRGMTKHASMQVFVATGCYDGSVPYFAVERTLDVAVQEPSLAESLTVKRYPTGHILYFEEPAATDVRNDIAAFIQDAVVPPS